MSFSTNFIPGKKMTPPIHLQEKKNEARGSELSLSCHFLKEPSSISGVFQKALILNEVQDSNTETFENSFTKKKKKNQVQGYEVKASRIPTLQNSWVCVAIC